MVLHEMMDDFHEEGLFMELADAKICQGIMLKAILDGFMNRKATMKKAV